MPFKVWNGTSWIESTKPRVWNGSTWKAPVTGRVWNGSSWVVFINPVNVTTHNITVAVGGTFNGYAGAGMTFGSNGTLYAFENRLNEGLDSYARLDGADFVGSQQVSGEWLLDGSGSDFQIKITRSGSYGTISGASFGTWTTMNSDVTISVDAFQADIFDTFTVEFRDVTTSTILDSCVVQLEALAAGIN